MIIEPYKGDYMQSHRMQRLSDTLTPEDITRRLDVWPDRERSGDGKVTIIWRFVVDGTECAIWDYKNARWSCFGPRAIFAALFPYKVTD